MTSELRTQALQVAGTLDPDVMTGAQAVAVVEDLAVADKAISATLLFAALRVAKTNAWQGRGHKSAADWLADVTGISVAEAHRQLGTAKKAEGLGKTKQAMKDGDLSASQANAVTDAATADPDAEDDLLDLAARDTHQNLREEASKRKAAATDTAERERRIRRNRNLRTGTDADGAFWGRFSGPGTDAATFEAMIRPFEELVFRHHRTDGRHDTHENRRYDAFFLMLAFYANLNGTAPPARPEPQTETPAHAEPTDQKPAAGPAERSQPEPARTAAEPAGKAQPPEPGPPNGSPPTWHPPWDPDTPIPLPAKIPGGNNTKVIVLVDHTALLRGHTQAGETCQIAGVGPISVHAARDILANDPFLAVVVKKGTDIINVAHHGRGLNAAQRTAIEANGLHCNNIACNRTINIEIDHRVGYAQDPTTELANAEPHCPHCHQLKTHHGWHLETGTGRRRFLPPGHPDNPLTARTGTGTAGSELPTGQALHDLMEQRSLTDDEMAQLEARYRANHPDACARADQLTLVGG